MTALDATGARALGSPVRGGLRLAVYLLWTLLLIPLQALAVALRSPLRFRIPQLYHRVCAAILGIGVVVRGQRVADGPVLFVSNHSSYLDITVLGSVIPGSFVAKSEVAGWPFFGALAKLQQTVFVERKARAGVERQRDDLGARLDAGDSLILFPEGTSSDGNRTLPFKTALFAVAARRIGDRPLTVQPVSIAPTRLDGIPMGIAFRPCYAWYGDMDLAPHLKGVLTDGPIDVCLTWGEAIVFDATTDRKAATRLAEERVRAAMRAALAGRGLVQA